MQICGLLLREGAQAYKKEGPKFMQRLVAKPFCAVFRVEPLQALMNEVPYLHR